MARTRTWTDDQLIEAVRSSVCITHVVDKIYNHRASSCFAFIRKHIKRLGLSIDHFNPRLANKFLEKHQNGKLDINKALVECSDYSCTSIRRSVKRLELIPYYCARCNNTGRWNDTSLTLQLDHINGIRSDNRIENLRWLCPNCHSQTSNFSRRKHTGESSNGKIVDSDSANEGSTPSSPLSRHGTTIAAYNKCKPPKCDKCKEVAREYRRERRRL
jgi:hypothetical protein